MDYFINIDSICDIDKTQIRECYDNGVIADLSLMFADDSDELDKDPETTYPAELPPITVTPCPEDDSHYWIVDGHHRYKAARNTGKTQIKARILDSGTVNDLDDLRFLQAAENAEAVANRTVETRRRQVKATIKKRPDWRTFQITRYCHVSYDLVNSVWAELEAQDAAQKPKKPIEKAAEAISKPENAGKSNRQIAKETGIALTTIQRAKKDGGEVIQNSERKSGSPRPPASVRNCDCCGKKCDEFICYDWNGENYYFCCLGCVYDFARKESLECDEVNHMFLEKDFDAQLEKVASKAREKLKAPEADSIPIQDRNNIEMIVDDVLNWLGDRADVFAVILRDRLENGN